MGLIGRAWPVTIKVGVATILIVYTFGTLLVFIAAIRQYSIVDYLVATVSLTVPNFMIATWLILLLAPTGG